MGDKTPKASQKLQKQKRAASVDAGPSSKRAVDSPPGDSAYDRHLRFKMSRIDLDGPWCLTKITPEDHKDLLTFMKEMEQLKVSEVIPARGKAEDVAGASPNAGAKRRAQDQYPDDHDYIHVLRVSGAKRLWGLLHGYEFSVIWWDPAHDIWPGKRVTDN